MIEYDRAVTPKELMCSQNFSPKVLAQGAKLIDEARQKFDKDGAVPVAIVQAMMRADGITKEFLLPDGEGLLVRNIDSNQWFHIHGKHIHGEFGRWIHNTDEAGGIRNHQLTSRSQTR